ncbi:MSTO1 protein, partial [Calcarius ornatus]|nr:MSTO1 protein [Calcarius ornatus]
MLHFADSLTFSGRKVVAARAALPLPALAGSSLPDVLSAHQEVPWKLLSSWKEQKSNSCFAQSVVLRGICQEKATRCPGQPKSPLHSCESPEQVLQHYLHSQFPGAFRWVWVWSFRGSWFGTGTAQVGAQFGWVQVWSFRGCWFRAENSSAVESSPVLAALQSCPGLQQLLAGLCRELRPWRWSSSCTAGLEQDDVQEALEELRTLAQCYETGFGADGSEDEADSD